MPALKWNVGNVVTMTSMFEGAEAFNQPLLDSAGSSAWDTSNVEKMNNMFKGAIAFNQDVSGFDVKKVGTMYGMFSNARAFDNAGDNSFGTWQPHRCTSMAYMFHNALAFNRNINPWGNFTGTTTSLGTVPGLLEMQYMFATAVTTSVDEDGETVYQVGPDGPMHYNGGMSFWDVSTVTDMTALFRHTSSFRNILGADTSPSIAERWNPASVVSFGDWGDVPGSVGPDSGTHMFQGGAYFNNRETYSNQTAVETAAIDSIDDSPNWQANSNWVAPWDSSTTLPRENVFTTLQPLQVALDNWMKQLDAGLPPELAEFPGIPGSHLGPIKQWNVSTVTTFANLGGYPDQLGGGPQYVYTSGQTYTVNGVSYTYYGPTYSTCITNWHLFNEYIGDWDFSAALSMESMFENARAFNNGLGNSFTGSTTAQLQAVESGWPSDIDYTNTGSGAVDPDADAASLKIQNSSVTSTKHMFKNATAFNAFIFRKIDSAGELIKRLSLTNIEGMFMNAEAFNRQVANLWVPNPLETNTARRYPDAADGTPERDVYYRTNNPLLANGVSDPVTEITKPNVTSFKNVFYGAKSFNKSVWSWYWVASGVTDMESMFEGAEAFDRDLSMWPTTNVTTLERTFYGAKSFNERFDLPHMNYYYKIGFNGTEDPGAHETGVWSTASVTNMVRTFSGATKFASGIGGWDVSNVTSFLNMFGGECKMVYPASDALKEKHFQRPDEVWNAQVSINAGQHWQANANWSAPWSGYYFDKNSDLRDAVQSSYTDAVTGDPVATQNVHELLLYGHIQTWNVSNVGSFQEVFKNITLMNEPGIAKWLMSGALSTEGMFKDAQSFNQDLSLWDVSNVENMKNMFKGAVAFNNGS